MRKTCSLRQVMTMNDWHAETCCAKRCAKQPVIRINGHYLCQAHHDRATKEDSTIEAELEKMTRKED
jgi:NADH:ubiquinone oxidoreductase subunit E